MEERSRSLRLQDATRALAELRQAAVQAEQSAAADLSAVEPRLRDSARNLVHYLALRGRDIRSLQVDLAALGLSSLGRMEAHVLPGLDAVLAALRCMTDASTRAESEDSLPAAFSAGKTLLARHTGDLLGPPSADRAVRIMVTLPSEASQRYGLVRDLIDKGTNVLRINSAHDDPSAWQQMVGHVRRAERELDRSCRILFDLGGPKLRTGAIEPGPAVLHINPRRNPRGFVEAPSRVLFQPDGADVEAAGVEAVIPVEPALIRQAQVGDTIEGRDLPGRWRTFTIVEVRDGAAVAEIERSAYLETGVPLERIRGDAARAHGRIGRLQGVPARIVLHVGDRLIVTRGGGLGRPARRNAEGVVESPARVSCSLPEVFDGVLEGDRIFFDDGKIGGVVQRSDAEGLHVEITRARPQGSKLGAEKGINLPDTHLKLPALSATDIACLDFATEHVDIVGLSFVRSAADIEHLHRELERRGADHLGIVLKIETELGFKSIPQLLLTGMRRPRLGVMVARGDLGVEVGFERMAEVQEEILWLCEAAHVPVIWATQILDSMNKTGLPTRGEVTDAAMSVRAECVMLNKGPYILKTVEFLHDVLSRMSDHTHKKTPMLRRLKVSEGRSPEGVP